MSETRSVSATGKWRIRISRNDKLSRETRRLFTVSVADSLIGNGSTLEEAVNSAKAVITKAFSEVNIELIESLMKAATEGVTFSVYEEDKDRFFNVDKSSSGITIVMIWHGMERPVTFQPPKNRKIRKEDYAGIQVRMNNFMASTRDSYYTIIDEIVTAWKNFNK